MTRGGKISPCIIYPNGPGSIDAGLDVAASDVKAGIPDLPVSGFPKGWTSLLAAVRCKEGTPGLPVPRIPKGWARRVAV